MLELGKVYREYIGIKEDKSDAILFGLRFVIPEGEVNTDGYIRNAIQSAGQEYEDGEITIKAIPHCLQEKENPAHALIIWRKK